MQLRTVPKESNYVGTDKSHLEVTKFVEAESRGKTLRIGKDAEGNEVLYAKKQTLLGKCLSTLNVGNRESRKQALVRNFIQNACERSKIDHQPLIANLKTVKSPKIERLLAPRRNIAGKTYAVVDQIGKSSTATINRAYEGDQLYVVKSFDFTETTSPEEDLEKAKNEAKMMKQAQGPKGHPNILPYLGSEEVGAITASQAKFHIAMPYLPNGDAAAAMTNMDNDPKLDNDPNLSRANCQWAKVRLLRDMLKGLQHAHKHGVIHGDIKFENLVLDEKVEGKLIDWDRAKSLGLPYRGETGRDDRTCKSPDLVAHDQAVRDDPNRAWLPSPADDVWSVGATFFRYLTREDAIPVDTEKTIAEQENTIIGFKTSSNNSFTSQRGVELPPQIASFLNKALQSDPSKRATIDQLLADPLFKNPVVDSDEITKIIREHSNNPSAPAQREDQLAHVGERV
jgi:serine/threonine protein kinase